MANCALDANGVDSNPSFVVGRARRWRNFFTPVYDCGVYYFVTADSEGEGQGWHFAFDWLGVHLSFVCGRLPQSGR